MSDFDLNVALSILVAGVGLACGVAVWQARRGSRQIEANGFYWKRGRHNHD